MEEAKLRLREAEAAAEQVKLKVDTIALQERKAAVGLGGGAVREGRASPHPFIPSRRPYGAPQGERSLSFETALRDASGPPQDDRT